MIIMIVFDNLWVTMKDRGITKYKLREKYNIDPRIIRRLMENDNVETKTLDKLCIILDCKIEDIATYINPNSTNIL